VVDGIYNEVIRMFLRLDLELLLVRYANVRLGVWFYNV
jgi:hypothetical protein